MHVHAFTYRLTFPFLLGMQEVEVKATLIVVLDSQAALGKKEEMDAASAMAAHQVSTHTHICMLPLLLLFYLDLSLFIIRDFLSFFFHSLFVFFLFLNFLSFFFFATLKLLFVQFSTSNSPLTGGNNAGGGFASVSGGSGSGAGWRSSGVCKDVKDYCGSCKDGAEPFTGGYDPSQTTAEGGFGGGGGVG